MNKRLKVFPVALVFAIVSISDLRLALGGQASSSLNSGTPSALTKEDRLERNKKWAFLWHWLYIPENSSTRDEIIAELQKPENRNKGFEKLFYFPDPARKDRASVKFVRPQNSALELKKEKIKTGHSVDGGSHFISDEILTDKAGALKEFFRISKEIFCKKSDYEEYCKESDEEKKQKLWKLKTHAYLNDKVEENNFNSKEDLLRHSNHLILIANEEKKNCCNKQPGTGDHTAYDELQNSIAKIKVKIQEVPEDNKKLAEKKSRALNRIELMASTPSVEPPLPASSVPPAPPVPPVLPPKPAKKISQAVLMPPTPPILPPKPASKPPLAPPLPPTPPILPPKPASKPPVAPPMPPTPPILPPKPASKPPLAAPAATVQLDLPVSPTSPVPPAPSVQLEPSVLLTSPVPPAPPMPPILPPKPASKLPPKLPPKPGSKTAPLIKIDAVLQPEPTLGELQSDAQVFVSSMMDQYKESHLEADKPGSFDSKATMQLLAAEAAVHYVDLVKNIRESGNKGFYRPGYQPGAVFESVNGTKEFANEVKEQFQRGKKVFSTVIGKPGHFLALAINQTGNVMVIDSLREAGNEFSNHASKNLVEALNNAQIKDVQGNPVKKFDTIQQVNPHSQKDGSNCLVHGVMNSFQIAKEGDINGYQSVVAALAGGKLKKYDDIYNIEDSSKLAVFPKSGASNADFFKSFRQETKSRLEKIVPESAVLEGAPPAPSIKAAVIQKNSDLDKALPEIPHDKVQEERPNKPVFEDELVLKAHEREKRSGSPQFKKVPLVTPEVKGPISQEEVLKEAFEKRRKAIQPDDTNENDKDDQDQDDDKDGDKWK